jgi:hypothetical protein
MILLATSDASSINVENSNILGGLEDIFYPHMVTIILIYLRPTLGDGGTLIGDATFMWISHGIYFSDDIESIRLF